MKKTIGNGLKNKATISAQFWIHGRDNKLLGGFYDSDSGYVFSLKDFYRVAQSTDGEDEFRQKVLDRMLEIGILREEIKVCSECGCEIHGE